MDKVEFKWTSIKQDFNHLTELNQNLFASKFKQIDKLLFKETILFFKNKTFKFTAQDNLPTQGCMKSRLIIKLLHAAPVFHHVQ